MPNLGSHILLDLSEVGVENRKKYGPLRSLSAVLSDKNIPATEKKNDIVDVIQSIADEKNRSIATELWDDIRVVKVFRNSEQHEALPCSAQALNAVDRYMLGDKKHYRQLNMELMQTKLKYLIQKYEIFD